MPVLNTKRETRKLAMVTNPEAWVEIKTKQNYGEYLEIQKEMMGDIDADELGKSKMKVDMSAFMIGTLEAMIVNWNWEDEEGNALPITRQNILYLDPEDAGYIFGEITESANATGLPQDEDAKNLEKNS